MADNIAITPGVGAGVKTDQDSGDSSHMQIVKLAYSGDGVGTLIGADANGLDVDVTRVSGVVHVDDNSGLISVDDGGGTLTVDDGAGSLTVDAPVGTPVYVRLSDGSSAIAALPITDNAGSITVDGAVTVSGTIAATQSGTWNIATLTTITNVVHIDDNAGNISIDDGGNSITVDGAVTVTQGTAAAASGAWFSKLTDGTDTVGISTVSAAKALKVDVVQLANNPGRADNSAFTEGTDKIIPIAGVSAPLFPPADLGVGVAAAVRISAKRSLWVSFMDPVSGNAHGIVGSPLRTDPVNTTPTTIQDDGGSITVDAPVATPVFVRLSDGTSAITALPITDNAGSITIDGAVSQSGAWTSDLIKINGTAAAVAAAGILKVGIVDGVGAVWSATNPLQVSVNNLNRTRFTNSNTLAASETAVAIWSPTSSFKACINSFTLTVTVSGVITIYDGTNSAANLIYKGTVPVGVWPFQFAQPWVSAAVNNVIRYTTGASVVAELQMHGFESV